MNRAQIIETMARGIAVAADWPGFDSHFFPGATAALSALEAAGLVVVPREPTPAMNSASYMLYMREKSKCDAWSGKKNGHLIYAAMINAAQEDKP